MEDTHGGRYYVRRGNSLCCLNPYCNGRYSWSITKEPINHWKLRLNPYCNGRYSWSSLVDSEAETKVVLILIVMEDTHGVCRLIKLGKVVNRS